MASRLFCLAGSAGLKSWRRGRGGLEAGLWLSQGSPRPSVSAVTFRRPLLAGVSVLSKPHLDLHTGQAWVYGPIQHYGGGKGESRTLLASSSSASKEAETKATGSGAKRDGWIRGFDPSPAFSLFSQARTSRGSPSWCGKSGRHQGWAPMQPSRTPGQDLWTGGAAAPPSAAPRPPRHAGRGRGRLRVTRPPRSALQPPQHRAPHGPRRPQSALLLIVRPGR